MFAKFLIGFGVAIMLSALAMGTLAMSGGAADVTQPFWVFAAGFLVSALGGRLRDAGRGKAGSDRGMWAARD